MGEDATWGRSTVERVRAGALPAAAVGHAVSLGQLADPVGAVRRGRRLARGLRLRLHAGAGRRRLPAGHVPHLRRRHGVGERRPRAARRLRRRPARRRGRAAAADRARPGRRLDRPRPARRRRPAARAARGRRIPDAGGLVVAIDKEHAEKLADRLARITGERPDIVHSDAADASARIARFSAGSAPWLVSVLMVSEGVDVPRLRVGVYATTARTELFFRQVIGRFIRRTPAPKDQMSHVFLPSDPRLKALAIADRGGAQPRAGARAERRRARRRARRARRGRRGVPGAVVERAPRRGRAADDPARRRAAAVRRAGAAGARRLRVHDDRRAVAAPSRRPRSSAASACAPSVTRWSATIARRTGEAHRTINARINRDVGAASVDKSTDDQLEKANRLLEREVARRR